MAIKPVDTTDLTAFEVKALKSGDCDIRKYKRYRDSLSYRARITDEHTAKLIKQAFTTWSDIYSYVDILCTVRNLVNFAIDGKIKTTADERETSKENSINLSINKVTNIEEIISYKPHNFLF